MVEIAKIKDEDFREEKIETKNPRIRRASRGIVRREDGCIAIFCKENKNEYKLPGGGIEGEETEEEAFIREVEEETGVIVKNPKLLGTIYEYRTHSNLEQISYIFEAELDIDTKQLKMTQKEIDEGGKMCWMKPEEALEKIKQSKEKLKASSYEDLYCSKFINLRDTKILEYYLENN